MCQAKYCYRGVTDEKVLPDFCPLRTFREVVRSVKAKYGDEEVNKIYLAAAETEKRSYMPIEGELTPIKPRIRELIDLSKRLGIKKLGVAFCIGLSEEARRVVQILEDHGFTVYSVVCKCGAIDKTELGVPSKLKLRDPSKFEAACNPILQAELLNRAKTEINIIVGLCVGHDMIFSKQSKAPVTTLVVKDRLTGHNPLASLFVSYHQRLLRR